MDIRSLNVKLPGKFVDFLDRYKNKYKHKIWKVCECPGSKKMDDVVEYYMRITMQIVDSDLYNDVFRGELDYPRYDMGILLLKLLSAYGIEGLDIKIDRRIICKGERPQYVVLLNNKIIHIIGEDNKSYRTYMQEIRREKECIPRVFAGDSSQLINYIMPKYDQKLIADSPDMSDTHDVIIDAECKEIPHIEAQNKPPIEDQNKPPIEDQNRPPIEDQNKPPIEDQNKPPIEDQNKHTINIQSGDIVDKFRSRNIFKSLQSKKK